MLPNEILAIIHTYRKEFEVVEKDINESLSIYYSIESRANDLISMVETMDLCDQHLNDLRTNLSDVVVECSKLVSWIIEEETITSTQKLMLKDLSEQIEYNHVFRILFHPLCFLNLFWSCKSDV